MPDHPDHPGLPDRRWLGLLIATICVVGFAALVSWFAA